MTKLKWNCGWRLPAALGEENLMYARKDWEKRIRMEAASQAIENTIQAVEDGLGTKFPRGTTPTESSNIMRSILQSRRP